MAIRLVGSLLCFFLAVQATCVWGITKRRGGQSYRYHTYSPVGSTQRPEAQRSKSGVTIDEYSEGRWNPDLFEYKGEDGNWYAGNSPLIVKSAGEKNNPDGSTLQYSEGDIIFATPQGWGKARGGSAQIVPVTEKTVPNPNSVPLTLYETYVIHYTNVHRINHGLAPLVVDHTLLEQSRLKAKNMAMRDGLTHAGEPALNGLENIGWNYSGAAAVVNGWYLSSGHRANMLNSSATRIGVGVYFSPRGEPYHAQRFR